MDRSSFSHFVTVPASASPEKLLQDIVLVLLSKKRTAPLEFSPLVSAGAVKFKGLGPQLSELNGSSNIRLQPGGKKSVVVTDHHTAHFSLSSITCFQQRGTPSPSIL